MRSTITTMYTYPETGYANPHAVTSVGGQRRFSAKAFSAAALALA
jgi:hypothetical protein